MKKKRSKPKRGRLYVSKRGPDLDGNYLWYWTVYLLPGEDVTLECLRGWETKAGAHRHVLRIMADLGIGVEE